MYTLFCQCNGGREVREGKEGWEGSKGGTEGRRERGDNSEGGRTSGPRTQALVSYPGSRDCSTHDRHSICDKSLFV